MAPLALQQPRAAPSSGRVQGIRRAHSIAAARAAPVLRAALRPASVPRHSPRKNPAARRVRVLATAEEAAEEEVATGLSLEEDFGALSEEVERLSLEVADALQGSSLYLVGMPGVGKSTTGRLLAKFLKYCFFDCDDVIVAAAQTSIAEIFEKEGEDAFRDTESNVIAQLSQYKNCVVATGGGAVLRTKNWAQMQQGVVVWLDGSPSMLAQRIHSKDGTGSRPLLAGDDSAENAVEQAQAKLEGLYEARKEKYGLADIIVDINGEDNGDEPPPAAIIAYKILAALDERMKGDAADREAKREFTIEDKGPIPIGERMEMSKNEE